MGGKKKKDFDFFKNSNRGTFFLLYLTAAKKPPLTRESGLFAPQAKNPPAPHQTQISSIPPLPKKKFFVIVCDLICSARASNISRFTICSAPVRLVIAGAALEIKTP